MTEPLTRADLALMLAADLALPDPEAYLIARPDRTMSPDVADLCRRWSRAYAEIVAVEREILPPGDRR